MAVTVHTITDLTPAMRRITFTGADLDHFVAAEPIYDQRIKVIVPGKNGSLPEFDPEYDAGEDWYTQWRQMQAEEAGYIRTYSVRDFADQILTVDFVIHTSGELTGPAGDWAAHAKVGDPAIIIGAVDSESANRAVEFNPRQAENIVIIGDETALPAISRILTDLPKTASGTVTIEVPTVDDIQLAIQHPGFTFNWLPRETAFEASHGTLISPIEEDSTCALDQNIVWETPTYSSSGTTLSEADLLLAGNTYYWIAGEAGAVTRLRRKLVNEFNIPRSAVSFMGYWKLGRSLL